MSPYSWVPVIPVAIPNSEGSDESRAHESTSNKQEDASETRLADISSEKQNSRLPCKLEQQ